MAGQRIGVIGIVIVDREQAPRIIFKATEDTEVFSPA
jgi:hypothetical protein